MPILINRDGKQMGPYSLDQARARVLSGELEADDWAWPDNATDWVLLKDVPGFAAKPVAPPAAPPTASPATEEEQLWRGHPSQALNLSTYLFWSFTVVLVLALALYFAGTTTWAMWAIPGLGVVGAVALAQVTWAYLHLRAIEYVVSTQRVRIVSGLFSKDIKEIELFRVKDTLVHQSFFLRLFGLGTITILSGDERLPKLVLEGIPNAVELRERLRHEVMGLRQRFGVRELDVM